MGLLYVTTRYKTSLWILSKQCRYLLQRHQLGYYGYIETIKTYGGTLWLFNIAMETMAHRNR